MSRVAFATLAVVLLAGVATVAIARLLGRSGSRASVLVSVIAHWLCAYVLWTFGAGLLLRYGALAVYDGALFPLLALAAGVWHYRRHLALGREQGLTVFVGAQLLWLVVVLVRNGLLSR